MTQPTPEQRAIIEDPSRVRVVQAAPGSGKTWLVSEVIRQELPDMPTGTGVAALSFTRVAGDEIHRAVGRRLGYPHFVGTIDSFLFRYVVRPHLRSVYPFLAAPRLLPAGVTPEKWRRCGSVDTVVGNGINIFSCACIDQNGTTPVFSRRVAPNQPLTPLSGSDQHKVLSRKKQVWKETGFLTHSDAAMFASTLLGHVDCGPVIRQEIARRFPLFIVDELQDTGHYLGQSIRWLLDGGSDIRGLLVGDPDQAIYEFNGAKPELFAGFSTIEGAKTLSLATSRRCPQSVVRIARLLSSTSGDIQPTDEQGHAVLVAYGNMRDDIRTIVNAARRPGSMVRVLARGSATIDDLLGQRVKEAGNLHCPAVTHLHRAVVSLQRGSNRQALSSATATIECAAFGHEGVGEEELLERNVTTDEWKALATSCLVRAERMPCDGTHLEWSQRAGELIDEVIHQHDAFEDYECGKLKPQRREGHDALSMDLLARAPIGDWPRDVSVTTVHGAKGETHDVTVLVCPKPGRGRSCPSLTWWDPENGEERRIAYVAMTRSRGTLVVCVSGDTLKNLTENQSPFVDALTQMTVCEAESLLSTR